MFSNLAVSPDLANCAGSDRDQSAYICRSAGRPSVRLSARVYAIAMPDCSEDS
jgi:hypothetical protein